MVGAESSSSSQQVIFLGGMSIFTSGTLSGITWSKDDVEKYALDEKLKKRLNDGLDHIQRVLVCSMVLPPITLKMNKFVTGIQAFCVNWKIMKPTLITPYPISRVLTAVY